MARHALAPRVGCLAVLAACLLLVAAACLWVRAHHGEAGEPEAAERGLDDSHRGGHAGSAPSGELDAEDQPMNENPEARGTGDPDEASGASADQEGLVVTVERGEAEQVATRLLSSYRDAGDCALASSGYLDLFGSVWGCVIQGDGWVDVCIVSEEGSDSRVAVLRLEGTTVAQQLLREEG